MHINYFVSSLMWSPDEWSVESLLWYYLLSLVVEAVWTFQLLIRAILLQAAESNCGTFLWATMRPDSSGLETLKSFFKN